MSGWEIANAVAVAVAGSGNVFVSGTRWGDYLTIKYSSAGVLLWTNRYNGPSNSWDSAHAVVVDSSGNVFVTGSSVDDHGGSDHVTLKYSSTGAPLWTNRHPGANGWYDLPRIALDHSGNVFVTGALATSKNLIKAVQLLCLPTDCQSWTVPTLLKRITRLPATLVKHARKLLARVEVAPSWLEWWRHWEERWWRATAAPAG